MPLSQSDGRLQLHVIPRHVPGASPVVTSAALASEASPAADSAERGASATSPGESDAESPTRTDVASATPSASPASVGDDAHLNVCGSHREPAAHPVDAPGVHVSLRATHWRVLGTHTEPLGQFSAAPGRQVNDGTSSPTTSSHPPLERSAANAVAVTATATPPPSRSAVRALHITRILARSAPRRP